MYNYFNFNGVQVNDLALVSKIEKPYIPETSISTLNIPSRDGEVFNGMKYNAIKIPISLAIIGTDANDYNHGFLIDIKSHIRFDKYDSCDLCSYETVISIRNMKLEWVDHRYIWSVLMTE